MLAFRESGVWCGFAPTTAPGGFIRGKTSSPISDHSDIPSFLLLDDPANELFLSVGLGVNRILTVELVDLYRGLQKRD